MSPILCERCERRQATEVRDEELLCDSCAQTLDEQAAERDLEQFHGGSDAWPLHLRGFV